jgi:hypothetical protein
MGAFLKLVSILTVCLFVACCSAGVLAQTLTTARIAGTVRDIQRAAIANAEVTAENTSTKKSGWSRPMPRVTMF